MILAGILLLVISGCTSFNSDPRIQTVTEYVTPNIIVQPRPRPITMGDVNFEVVTEKNLEEFIKNFRKNYGEVVFVAMPVRDYERLAINIQDIRRFIKQQTELIVYYEDSISQIKNSEIE